MSSVFLRFDVCPDCRGSRFSEAARAPKIMGVSIDEVSRMPLVDLCAWVDRVPASLPPEMRAMAECLCEAFRHTAARLLDLGLGYLSLDRAASTLSTGERQRMQLARAVRNRTRACSTCWTNLRSGSIPPTSRGSRP